jgi:hypothetical protein
VKSNMGAELAHGDGKVSSIHLRHEQLFKANFILRRAVYANLVAGNVQ